MYTTDPHHRSKPYSPPWAAPFNLFLHDLNPSGLLINRLKYFRIRFDFADKFEFWSNSGVCISPRSQTKCLYKKIRGVHHTAESDSAVCIIPRIQTAQCVTYRWDWLRGVHHTAGSREQNFYIKKKIRGVHHTAKSNSAVCYCGVRLGRIETEFENNFSLFSKGLDGFVSWKK